MERAVIYVRHGTRASWHQQECMARANADGLAVAEITNDAEAARAALADGRADRVVTVWAHAQDLFPELVIC